MFAAKEILLIERGIKLYDYAKTRMGSDGINAAEVLGWIDGDCDCFGYWHVTWNRL